MGQDMVNTHAYTHTQSRITLTVKKQNIAVKEGRFFLNAQGPALFSCKLCKFFLKDTFVKVTTTELMKTDCMSVDALRDNLHTMK